MASTARPARKRPAPLPPPEHTILQAGLVEYLGSSAVTELVIVESEPGVFRIEAQLTWRTGRSLLVAARGERTFRRLDTVATLLRTLGIGATLVRLELRA